MFMNRARSDILNILISKALINQRILAEESGYSLGIVNQSLKNLMKDGYLTENYYPTLKTKTELEKKVLKEQSFLQQDLE